MTYTAIVVVLNSERYKSLNERQSYEDLHNEKGGTPLCQVKSHLLYCN